MSSALYMDHHVPSAVTNGLRNRKIEVLTAADDGAEAWPDEKILERALELGRTVYTQDDDFLSLAHQWRTIGREHQGIVYAHQHSITIGEAVHHLELIALAMEPVDLRNQVVFIPFA